MRKMFRWLLTLTLLFTSAALQPDASAFDTHANEPAARMTADDSIALLPKTDVLIALDVSRAFNELLPKIKTAWPEQYAKIQKELDEFMKDAAESGVDLMKVKTAYIGLNLFSDNVTGAAVVEGITLDAARMEKYVKELKTGGATVAYKGKTLYLDKSNEEDAKAKAKTPAKGSGKPAAPKTGKSDSALSSVAGLTNVSTLLKQNTAIAQLDSDRVVIGDEAEVKNVIDALSENNTTRVGSELRQALRDTNAAGMLRLAVNIPDNLRQMAEGEEFLKNLAVTKLVLGTVDVTEDMGLVLDAKLRTGSAADATKLQESLAALVGLGKMMLGGNQDPMMVSISKALDQLKLTLQTNDVAVGLTVPRSLYEILLKPDAPEKKEK